MRAAFLAVLLLVAALCPAADYGTLLARALEQLPRTEQPPGEDPATGPDKPTMPNQVQIQSAGTTTRRGDVITFEDGATIVFRERTLTSQDMSVNTRDRTAILRGQARAEGQGDELEGNEIRINFRSRTYNLQDGRSTISPSWLEGRVLGPVYVTAGELAGSPDRVDGRHVCLTTCDLEHPHYDFSADAVEVLPGDRVILRRTRVRGLGRRLFTLPTLTIPLLEGSDRYVPQVGQSPDEGYFIKARWSTEVGTEVLDFLTDYMTKLGLGLGSEFRNATGLTRVYGILGRDPSLIVSNNFSGRVGPGLLNFDGLYQRAAYQLAPETTVTSGRLSYALNSGSGNTLLTAYRTGTETGGFSSVSESVTITDRRTWGGDVPRGVPRREQVLNQIAKPTQTPAGPLTTDINLTWNRSNASFTGGGNRSERFDVRFGARQTFSWADAEFAYERSIPISRTQSFLGGRDRTPYFELRSDAGRLGLLPSNMPFRLNFETSIGELTDTARRRPITRMTFRADLQGNQRTARSPFNLTYSGQFFQGMYSDDTAQYIMRYDARASYRIGDSSIGLNYRTLKPVGFTPLALDRQGRYDNMGLDAQFNFRNGLQFQVQTGYDFLAGHRGIVPWQHLSLQANYLPNDRLRIRTNASYDTFSQVWSFIRLDADFWLGPTRAVIAARYDARRSIWGGLSAVVEGFRWGKIGGNLGIDYNGYTRRIEAQQLELTYDLHCLEAVLEYTETRSGFRAGRQIGFFIRIKALPGGNPFGTGSRGQNLFGGAGGF